MIRAYFLSDLHLRDIGESNSQKLLLFLHSLENKKYPVTHLFLVGDIFDLWIANHRYFIDKFLKIVNAIKAVVAQGIEVHYFEGNHDLYLKNFWQQEVGVKVHEGPVYFSLGTLKVRVEHGDFMNPEDKGYLFLRRFLRSFPIKTLAQNLPGKSVSWIGEKMSHASRKHTSGRKMLMEEKIKEFMHNYAEQVVEQQPFDYLITGHTHVRDIYEFANKGEQVFSINLGSWFDEQNVLMLDPENGHEFLNLN